MCAQCSVFNVLYSKNGLVKCVFFITRAFLTNRSLDCSRLFFKMIRWESLWFCCNKEFSLHACIQFTLAILLHILHMNMIGLYAYDDAGAPAHYKERFISKYVQFRFTHHTFSSVLQLEPIVKLSLSKIMKISINSLLLFHRSIVRSLLNTLYTHTHTNVNPTRSTHVFFALRFVDLFKFFFHQPWIETFLSLVK